MDLFKQNNNDKSTAYDFYDTNIVSQNKRLRAKEKKMLHKLSRARIKKITMKEIKLELE